MDEYPDGYVTQPVPGSRPPVAFGVMALDPVAFEEEEPEHPDSAIGYGSLLSLGSSMRKKKPLIVIDPVEAENEARRVQFVAAQQLVDPDEVDGIDFLDGLAQFAEPDVAEEDIPEAEIPDAERDMQINLPAESQEAGEETAGDSALPESGDTEIEPHWEPAEAMDDPVETPDRELSLAVEGLARIYEASGIERIATVIELEPVNCEPAPAQSETRPHGHSLRARMPIRPPRTTFGDRATAFLGWLRDWLTRPR